jgi:hypothetical protein
VFHKIIASQNKYIWKKKISERGRKREKEKGRKEGRKAD